MGDNVPKITYQSKRVERDQSGEEISSVEDSVYRYDSEPPHIKIYLKDILYLADMPGRYNSLLRALFGRVGWDNRIVLNAALKRIIAKEIGSTDATIDNYLGDLVKGEILIREDKGLFVLNPFYFGKGKWKQIEDLRITLNYTPKGRTFATTITYKDEIASNKAIREEAEKIRKESVADPVPATPATDEEKVEAQGQQPMICKHCGGTEVIYKADGQYGPWYKCKTCGKGTSAERKSA